MNLTLSSRNPELEFLDAHSIPAALLFKNYRELHGVNRFLGGYASSQKIFDKFDFSGTYTSIWDIGCGGGQTLGYLQNQAEKRGIPVSMYGIDRHSPALDYARQNNPSGIAWINKDYRQALAGKKADIIHAALFTHHLDAVELRSFLGWARDHARQGIFINDLRRSFPAWLGIWLVSRWPGFSHLFKHDAPLSVLRSHSREEWLHYLREAGFRKFSVESSSIGRYVICAYV